MNKEIFTTSKRGAFAAWDNDTVSGGCDLLAQSQPRDPAVEWEANYLLPQLVPGAEYLPHATNAAVSRWLRHLFSGLWAPQMVPQLFSRRATNILQ
ncbi:hypothetical protein HP532_11715 [Pseudomonas sp. CrR25]|nr:hypothetical protein [Pseudomonas sp. CrR25]